ncbi:3-phosphoshikimate 1-carboxyvinyltransferase [Enterobacter sp. C4G1]|uniref:3-phosphoshikimate 1-carboxyvinyltransferase n=1 Tax=Enterobacter sp. C4G1 TaxID=3458724 RepID=UPI004068A07A
MESLTLQPIARVDGTINLPGSKSVSNRALLLAALANGTTVLTNLLDSDDVRHMLNALKALGVHYTLSDDRTRCEVTGNGGALHSGEALELHSGEALELHSGEALELFLGNAGTAMRPLAAALCLGSNNIVLTGEPRMKERPIGHLVDALRQGGAQIDYLEQKNYPPLLLRGGFTGGSVEVDGSVSSQFLTALLMTAPLAPQDTVITIKGDLVSKPYIDITLHLMKTFGVDVENQTYQRFVVRGAQQYQSPGNYLVEGDASSASYFLAAGAIKGGTVKVTGIGRNSVQGDIRFADVLEKMGAVVTWGDDFISCTHRELNAIDMDMNHIPDAAMTIATAALFAKGTTTLRNIYNWRVKETDRLFAMATELRKVGAEVEEGEDYIRVTPPAKLQVAEIGTYNDHRMAMCFSLVALSDTPVTILDPKCTAKTFPDYFEQLARISTLA